jgi:hypothetical protein
MTADHYEHIIIESDDREAPQDHVDPRDLKFILSTLNHGAERHGPITGQSILSML